MKKLNIRCYSISRLISKEFEYNHCFSRDISHNVNNGLRLEKSITSVNIDNAIEQKVLYHDVLKSLGIKITNLLSDSLPDSCFIEDTMVIKDRVLCITNPGAISRRLEIKRVEEIIKELNYFQVTEMDKFSISTMMVVMVFCWNKQWKNKYRRIQNIAICISSI